MYKHHDPKTIDVPEDMSINLIEQTQPNVKMNTYLFSVRLLLRGNN